MARTEGGRLPGLAKFAIGVGVIAVLGLVIAVVAENWLEAAAFGLILVSQAAIAFTSIRAAEQPAANGDSKTLSAD